MILSDDDVVYVVVAIDNGKKKNLKKSIFRVNNLNTVNTLNKDFVLCEQCEQG